MDNSLRFGPALSAIAMATVIAGCAAPQSATRSASIFGGKVDTGNIGLATKALMALNAKDYTTAATYAERAVANSPRDAGFRALLGHAYFGAGRFASAESAYRDSLSLVPNQPQVVLKRVLVTIAQGRNAEALSVLEASRDVLDPSDYGLALALAGRPEEAANVLEAAARAPDADSRLRQNLALAHALSGDWDAARTIAAQDLSADLVDARIQQWMTFAKPHGASDQVAALTGVTPVLSDPGQPVRLALTPVNTRVAQAAPVAAPQPQAYTQFEQQPVAALAPPSDPAFAPSPLSPRVAAAAQPTLDYQAADASPPPPPRPAERDALAPTAEPAPQPQPVAVMIAAAAASAPDAPAAFAAMAAFAHRPQVAKKSASRGQLVRASMPRSTGKSSSVVQLGAYGTPQRVVSAWSAAAHRFAALRAYSPMSARFNSPKGVVYRLSVHGFDSSDQAKNLCVTLRRSGGSCFVRSVAGDAPVQVASR
ncbi:MAG: tetratricopeptide repeat protein [Sphingomicrobium sp.]